MTDSVNRLEQSTSTGYVPRDFYETRHVQLIERDGQLDASIRQERQERDKAMEEVKSMFRDVGKQLESARIQEELRYKSLEESVDRRLKENNEAQLSSKDRAWIGATQILSWLALALAMTSPFVAYALTHIRFK